MASLHIRQLPLARHLLQAPEFVRLGPFSCHTRSLFQVLHNLFLQGFGIVTLGRKFASELLCHYKTITDCSHLFCFLYWRGPCALLSSVLWLG